jgi:hypothetical protein
VNTVMNLRVPGYLSISWVAISFSYNILHQGAIKYRDYIPVQLTSWSRVILERLIVTQLPQLVKTFSVFYRSRKFITVLTRDRQLNYISF